MIALLNGLIGFLCFLIAAILAAGGNYSAAIAYTGFGVGYGGLFLLYAGMQ